MVVQNTTCALVQRICHVQNPLIREPLHRHAFWDEIPQQASVAFALNLLPRAVRMRKVELGTEVLELRQNLKLRTVFGHCRLKNLAEALCAIIAPAMAQELL